MPAAPTCAVFAYGSLIYEPECPEHVVAVLPATLPGYRRAFDKLSWARGVDARESAWPHVDAPADFLRDGHQHSLALGLQPADATVAGAVLLYDTDVVAHLDRREGATGPDPGYRRVRVTANGDTPAWTYVTNRDSSLYRPLDTATVARVLLRATPAWTTPARGAHYLDGIRRWLAEHHTADDTLDAVAAALRDLGYPSPV